MVREMAGEAGVLVGFAGHLGHPAQWKHRQAHLARAWDQKPGCLSTAPCSGARALRPHSFLSHVHHMDFTTPISQGCCEDRMR